MKINLEEMSEGFSPSMKPLPTLFIFTLLQPASLIDGFLVFLQLLVQVDSGKSMKTTATSTHERENYQR